MTQQFTHSGADFSTLNGWQTWCREQDETEFRLAHEVAAEPDAADDAPSVPEPAWVCLASRLAIATTILFWGGLAWLVRLVLW